MQVRGQLIITCQQREMGRQRYLECINRHSVSNPHAIIHSNSTLKKKTHPKTSTGIKSTKQKTKKKKGNIRIKLYQYARGEFRHDIQEYMYIILYLTALELACKA